MAGVSLPSLASNDLWTIPVEESERERWAAEDRAELAGIDIATWFHELQLRDIVAAIQDGRPPAVDGHDGRAAVALMAAIDEASRSGGRVQLAAED